VIAPLWDDLRTDNGGDKFIDESVPDQVAIRRQGSACSSGRAGLKEHL